VASRFAASAIMRLPVRWIPRVRLVVPSTRPITLSLLLLRMKKSLDASNRSGKTWKNQRKKWIANGWVRCGFCRFIIIIFWFIYYLFFLFNFCAAKFGICDEFASGIWNRRNFKQTWIFRTVWKDQKSGDQSSTFEQQYE
jgi:hypothetical protein